MGNPVTHKVLLMAVIYGENDYQREDIMNIFEKNNRLWTTSFDVAKESGKTHKAVLSFIDKLDCSMKFRRSNFRQYFEKERGKIISSPDFMRVYYEISRSGFDLLIMSGFGGRRCDAWKGNCLTAFTEKFRSLFRPVRPDKIVEDEVSQMDTKDFIPIFWWEVDTLIVQMVKAKDLHEFLGVKKDFSDWIENKIKKYYLIEGHEYLRSPHDNEYYICLIAADVISMERKTPKGKQAYAYFREYQKLIREAFDKKVRDLHCPDRKQVKQAGMRELMLNWKAN